MISERKMWFFFFLLFLLFQSVKNQFLCFFDSNTKSRNSFLLAASSLSLSFFLWVCVQKRNKSEI